ncbi:hypothetical protein KKA00_11435 [bacterium]|nr:hypothetical protein [bacterium]MBU1652827.1 hypothetical protein [bacterium]MBU1881894.1 hypothetical protein [bacterium]
MMKLFKATALAIAFITGLLMLSSCQPNARTPESLAEKIAKDLLVADQKARAVFFDSKQQLAEDHLVVIYVIDRQDTPDDPWRSKYEVQFVFRPSTDAEALEGWYLHQIAGDYLYTTGIGEGLQFEWDYTYFMTVNGPREGIIGLEGFKQINF